MDPLRFIPRLEEIEERYTPAVDLSGIPAPVLTAVQTGHFFFTGTNAALDDQSFIRVAANRAPTQALATVIEAQGPALANIIAGYIAQLQTERVGANPIYQDWYNEVIDTLAQYRNEALASATQARAVSTRIDQLNAASAAAGTTGVGGTTGTTGTGTGTTGTTTGTAGVAPTTGTTGTTGTGTTTGNTSGITPSPVNSNSGTTGPGSNSSTTGTTPTGTGTTSNTTGTPGVTDSSTSSA